MARTPRRTLLPLAIALLLLAPAGASATTAGSAPDGGLSVTGTTGNNTVGVSVAQDGTLTVTDSSGMDVAPGEGTCSKSGSSNTAVSCPPGSITALAVNLDDGDDRFTSTTALPAVVHGDDGNDTITAGGGADTIDGGAGADSLHGGGGVDALDGGSGNDTIDGGPGNDAERGGGGNDQIDPGPGGQGDADLVSGGDGVDGVSYAARQTPVNVSLDGVAGDGSQGEGDNVQPDVEQATGGTADDTLTGSAADNALAGGPGADTLGGAAGNDAIDGGGGDDTGDGGEGNDVVSGGAGSDDMSGGAGNDRVEGSVAALVGVDGNDHLSGDAGDDLLSGDEGDDTLVGGPGADTLGGGAGIDTASYGTPGAARAAVRDRGAPSPVLTPLFVTLDGTPDDGAAGEGDNVEPDVENVRGGDAADTFTGSSGANGLDGGAGEDYMDGGDGSDLMAGGTGFDVIRARDGNPDVVDCGAGGNFAILDKFDAAGTGCDRIDRGTLRKPRRGRLLLLRAITERESFRLRGMHRFVPMKDTLALPPGSRLDATDGRVLVKSAGLRRVQSAVISRGAFLVKQSRRRSRRGLTVLKLKGGDFKACEASGAGASKAAARSARRRRVRRLFGRGRGRFRTRGRHSTATVRGTRWKVIDRCDGTLTKVQRGTVRVFDREKKRHVTLHAGERYLARAR